MNNQHVKILLADDDPEDRSIMQIVFDELDLSADIFFVEDGTGVIEYLREVSGSTYLPDLIVLDLNMPKLSGSETLKILKTHDLYKNIPIIIFSTSLNEIQMRECMAMGASSYVIKPNTFEECLTTGRRFYEFSRKQYTFPALMST
ncbi:response regulator [Chitinophaga sedimenti]|uniref:response regulator n=1 Tax=Chitinophaga sedimenti TaxID=2033606 RepID=UPI002002E9CA|nr:response regulator [Chitinophaga sedimenti]MCK7554361.1 response regulator [Chitinophaga sedimenti]